MFPTTYMHRSASGTYASLEELQTALKHEMNAGSQSQIPECTTSELSLDLSALITLLRPTIGPYAEGGDHDLPEQFKTNWTASDDPKKSNPQANVGTIISIADSKVRAIVQRAASRGVVAAVEEIDSFKYSFNNAWGAKDEDGQRFSYVCQDSMQNKDRHANGFTRTQKHVKGSGERGARKPTYDCKGSVSVKCSLQRRCVDVYYRHNAIHPTISERKALPRHGAATESDQTNGGNASGQKTTGGLFAQLQNEKSAFMPPPKPSTHVKPPMRPVSQNEVSNIGKPLKRKRDSEAPQPSTQSGKPMSLVDLLKQSPSAESTTSPSPATAKTSAPQHHPPVAYDLPSWQKSLPPVPINRLPTQSNPAQQSQSSASLPGPYPPPYHQPPPPPHAEQLPPLSQRSVPPRPPSQQNPAPPSTPQPQGLFTKMKPIASEPRIIHDPNANYSRARTSCTNCRFSKKKCDEQRPKCGGCLKAGRYDCVYEGVYSYRVPIVPQTSRPQPMQSMQDGQFIGQPLQRWQPIQQGGFAGSPMQAAQPVQPVQPTQPPQPLHQPPMPQVQPRLMHSNQFSTPPSQPAQAMQPVQTMQQYAQAATRDESPDPWFPKR